MATIELDQGTIHYEEAGPENGRPVVFVHGYLMAGDLWAEVGELLAASELRAIMPTWPLGAHPDPMKPGADLTPRGIARIVAAFLEKAQLDDVVLVGNDTGGAICQIVAAHHPERLGALVLTNCDAFENFPPTVLKPMVAAAKVPGAMKALMAPMRSAKARRSPLGYGMLSHGDIDHLARGWVEPVLNHADVREDLRRFTVALHKSATLEAAERLRDFGKPALIAWATDDSFFPLEDARRLAELLPDARLETIDGSRTFSMIDKPDKLAELIAGFAGSARQPDLDRQPA